MLFSERNGYVKVREHIQFESIDEVSRNRLWDLYYQDKQLWDAERECLLYRIIKCIWQEILKKPIDTIPISKKETIGIIRYSHFSGEWHEVFGILEIIYRELSSISENTKSFSEEPAYGFFSLEPTFKKKCVESISAPSNFLNNVNALFKRECVGYHLMIDGKVCPITDALEIEQIEIAVNAKSSPAQTHIQRALELLSDRKQHDYRNSIKESISAVESTVKIISNSENGTLGELLKRMNLHKAFRSGLSSMYGYTSDADGIRHALIDESSVPSFADAKFFLVMCASFINYLHDKNSTVK